MKRFPIQHTRLPHLLLATALSTVHFWLLLEWQGNVIPVSHEDEGGDAIEDGHHEIRQGQVHQEVVCHTPHCTVSWQRKLNLENCSRPIPRIIQRTIVLPRMETTKIREKQNVQITWSKVQGGSDVSLKKYETLFLSLIDDSLKNERKDKEKLRIKERNLMGIGINISLTFLIFHFWIHFNLVSIPGL